MTLRKQKDPKMQEAGRRAAETRRRNLERQCSANGKTDGKKANDQTHGETHKISQESQETETRWHLSPQSSLASKVRLHLSEHLTDRVEVPWVESHRPITLSDCIGPVVGYLKAFAKTGSFPLALIFYGEYGCGKSACAKALVRDYFVLRGLFKREATFNDITNATKVTREYDGIFPPALLIDSTLLKSAGNGFSDAEIIRTRVQNFMRYSFGNFQRFALIEEADRMGHDCQEVLTSLIEKYPKTRTIWTLNDIDNIMDRIVDRAAGGVFEFRKPDQKQIVSRLRQIAKSEKMRINEQRLKEIATKAPSIRSAVGMLQQECILIKATGIRRK